MSASAAVAAWCASRLSREPEHEARRRRCPCDDSNHDLTAAGAMTPGRPPSGTAARLLGGVSVALLSAVVFGATYGLCNENVGSEGLRASVCSGYDGGGNLLVLIAPLAAWVAVA